MYWLKFANSCLYSFCDFYFLIKIIYLCITNCVVMTESEKALATFQTRVRQMILRFEEMKKENQDLYAIVEKNEQDIKQLQAKLNQQERDYQSLKMAKMMEITDRDLDGAKERLSKLIRDVNKCIAVLSDEK